MAKIWRVFDVFEEGVMVAGMVVMVFFNFLNVVCRYLLPQTPFSYTEELVVLVFVWVSLFGISYGYRARSHTVLTLVTDHIPRSCQGAIVLLSALASCVLMVLLVKTGYAMVMNQVKFGQILPGMRIPMAIVGWAIPAGASITFLSVIKSALGELKALREADDQGEASR